MRRRINSSAAKKAFVSWAILALALSPATPALAAAGKGTTTSGSIRITESISHKAYAYQVFDGDVEDDGSISDIQWGSGVRENDIETELRNSRSFSTTTTAKAVAEKLSVITYDTTNKRWKYIDGIPASGNESISKETDLAKEFAEIVSRCLNTANRKEFTGTDQPTASGLDDGWYVVASDYSTNPAEGKVLLFPGLITVGAGQSSVTPKESKPTFKKEVQEDSTGTWQKYADFEIGQTFQQRLIATIGDADVNYYNSYYLGFSDTLPEGQDILDLSKVKVMVGSNNITSKFDTTYTNHKLEVNAKENLINDISAGAEVIVTYETVLTSTAKIGSAGNVNTAKLTYSADPRTTQSGTEEIRTTTPEDTATAYTYELKLTKTDSKDANKVLAGAKFSLRRTNGDYAVLSVYGGEATDNATNNNTGNQRVYIKGWVSSASSATYVTTGQDGTASIVGLDAGDSYTLNEVVAPDGYDLDARDIPVVITANAGTSGTALANLAVSVSGGAATNGDTSTGIVSMGATNVKAPILPTTGLGGIATSVLLGSGLVAVSATVIATQMSRKRKE